MRIKSRISIDIDIQGLMVFNFEDDQFLGCNYLIINMLFQPLIHIIKLNLSCTSPTT